MPWPCQALLVTPDGRHSPQNSIPCPGHDGNAGVPRQISHISSDRDEVETRRPASLTTAALLRGQPANNSQSRRRHVACFPATAASTERRSTRTSPHPCRPPSQRQAVASPVPAVHVLHLRPQRPRRPSGTGR